MRRDKHGQAMHVVVGQVLGMIATTTALRAADGPRQQVCSDRSPRCELVAGRSIEVICAGQAVKHGLLRSVPDDAVAALSCCTMAGLRVVAQGLVQPDVGQCAVPDCVR